MNKSEKRIELLNGKIEQYLKRGQLVKDEGNLKLEVPFTNKARKNLLVANLILRISQDTKLKKRLNITPDFEMYEWVINISYYAMYIASLAAIAKLGYRSRSHHATITILEYNYVYLQKGLEIKHLTKLTKAYALNDYLLTTLLRTKTRRESAQYEATPLIAKENALSSVEDADEFITRIEEILIQTTSAT